MKVLYQDALRNPQGWQQCDASEWWQLSKRHVPDRGERGGRDDEPGWVRNVSIQGICTEGYDHVAIASYVVGLDEGVRMVVWNDDADDLGPGERVAIVATILPLAPDPHLGMAINTRQSFIRYAEGDRYERLVLSPPQNTTIRPWSEFERPPEELTRHGVWMADASLLRHLERAPQSEFGWMHWCDHLPDSECEIETERIHERQRIPLAAPRRVLKEQRAQGRYHQAGRTITYYQRDTDSAAGWCGIASHEDALSLSTAASATESVTTNADVVNSWGFTSPANEPNSADWPSGVFHAQLNCTAASAGLVYGCTSGGNTGLVRCGADASATLEVATVANGNGDGNDFSGTGLKLATSNTTDMAAGAAGDRFGVPVSADGDGHGDAITLTLNTTDSYADGPWSAGDAFFPGMGQPMMDVGALMGY